MKSFRIVAGCLALALSGCSSGGFTPGSGLSQSHAIRLGDMTPSRRSRNVGLRLKLKSRHRDLGRYLSPATESVVVRAYDGTNTVLLAQATFNTLAGSGACTPVVMGSYSCSFSLAVPIGNDTFDVEAFDAPNGNGNGLSATKDFPFEVAIDKANQLNLTLGGIPASIEVGLVGNPPFAFGNDTLGFQFGGVGSGATQQLRLTAYDADGYAIVAPGLPGLSLTASDPRVLVTPVTGQVGLFDITPLAETNARPVASAPLSLSAKATPAFGTPISALVGLQLEPVTFVETSTSTVVAFVPWSSSPVLTIDDGGDFSSGNLAIDSSGNLYISNHGGSTVSVYSPGTTTYSRRITLSAQPGQWLQVDNRGNIFVQESETIEEYAPTNNTTPIRSLSFQRAQGFVVDAAGNLFVADAGNNAIDFFPPGSSTASATITAGVMNPADPTIDSHGLLYVSDVNNDVVKAYKLLFTIPKTVLASFGSSATLDLPEQTAVDGNGNVYIENWGGSVVELSQSQPTVPVRTFPLAQLLPIAVDPLGYVYVPSPNNLNGPIAIYAPGTSTTAVASYATDIDTANFIAVWP